MIKEIAEQVKNENGNEKVTNAELLWYIVKRIDDISDKKADKSNVRWMFGILFTFIIIMLGVILR